MNKTLKITWLLMFLGISTMIFAQTKNVTGKVVDEKGEPLPGVTVLITGTQSGTITDFDGVYNIAVTPDQTSLTYSFIGYALVDEPINGRSTINMQLKPDVVAIDEVVAIGYGGMKKSDLTGSVASISGEKLKESVVVNPDQMMKGKIAGVQIQANSGAPGAANSIRIRGASSINSSNEPLYIIDGIPVSGSGTETAGYSWTGGSGGQTAVNPLAAIAPSDIVSIDVLKDASATAIYGAAGANGVVIVTTKRGKEGKAVVTYDGYVAVQSSIKQLDMMNLREYGQYQKQLYDEGFNNNVDDAYTDPSLLGEGTDWQDAVTKDAVMHNHAISISGGTERTKYAASVGYSNQEGMIIGSDFERFNGRINFDSDVSDYLKTGASLAFTRTDQSMVNNDGINGVVMQAALMSPAVPVYDFDGNYAGPETVNGSSIYNPVSLTQDQDNTLLQDRVFGNLYAEITAIKDLKIRSEFGMDLSHSINKGFQPSYKYGLLENTNIKIMKSQSQSLYWIWKNYATYNKTINKHSFTLMAGTETSKSGWESSQIIKDQLSSNEIRIITSDGELVSTSGSKDGSTTVSAFGRLNYNYAGKYMLTATLRSDASSKFGANNRWGYFPSFAGAWRISGEEFMSGTQAWLDNLKLRLGYGQVGNSNVATYRYGSKMRAFQTNFGTAYRMENNANPDLKWEASEQYNGGLDISLLGSVVNITVDAYYKTTKGLLLQPSISPVLGGSGWTDIQTPYQNMGKIDNKGVDIAINTQNIRKTNFTWSTDFVFSLNRNKVVELDEYETPIYGSLDWYSAFQTVSMITVGQPIGVFYGYETDGIFTSAEDLRNSPRPSDVDIHRTTGSWVGDVKFKDLSGPNGVPDGEINEYDQKIIGDPNPDFTYGLTNTLTYNNWELGIGITGSYGADILNYVRVKTEGANSLWDNQDTKVLNRAQLGYVDGNNYDVENVDNAFLLNPNAELPRWSGNDNNGNNRMSDRWIEDGSYLRIQNISLSYNLPKNWLDQVHINRCKLYVNVQNVYTFTNYSGLDPEIGSYNQQAGLSNVDMGRYPSPRVYTFGANITF